MLPRHPSVHPTPRRPSLCRGIALWSHRCDGKPSPQTPRDGIPSPLPHEPRRPQPRPSQAPHDRALQTPTPCGIPLHKPSRPARQVTFASPSINHAALILRDGSPHISFRFPLRQPPRPRPANAFAAQDSLTYSPRHPARRDTFASPPCPRPCPPFPRIRWRPFPRARDSRAAMRIACRGGRARRVKRPLKG